jgi:hypothetical protein
MPERQNAGFYGEFTNTDDCFIELVRAEQSEVIASIRAGLDSQAHWRDQMRSAVKAYIHDIEARPAITVTWIRELAGPGAGTDRALIGLGLGGRAQAAGIRPCRAPRQCSSSEICES